MLILLLACARPPPKPEVYAAPAPSLPPIVAHQTPIATTSSLTDVSGLSLDSLPPELRDRTVDGFLAAHRTVPGKLAFNASAARGLNHLRTAYELDASELAAIARQGFVLAGRLRYDSYGYAYTDILSRDMPVFVTLDSGFYALHISADSAVALAEQEVLVDSLTGLLADLQRAWAASDDRSEASLDVGIYLGIARSLLLGESMLPTELATQEPVARLYGAAHGHRRSTLTLWGEERSLHFELLEPRGHYTRRVTLSRYFEAVGWLALASFPLEGAAAERHRASALTLTRLLDRTGGWERLAVIEGFLSGFAGEPGGVTPAAFAAGVSGHPRVRSGNQAEGPGASSLADTFSLLPGRATTDGIALASLVDPPATPHARTRPNTQDLLFALGNDAAAALLEPDLREYGYQAKLELARMVVERGATQATSYGTDWINALRTLNPRAADARLPTTFRTAEWQAMRMHTQLAAYTQLRHDSVLYTQVPFGYELTCSFPDHYVDPSPEAWTALARAARHLEAVLQPLGGRQTATLPAHFASMATTFDTLAAIAQVEVARQHLSAEQTAFLADLVDTSREPYSGTVRWSGWFPKLLYPTGEATEPDRIVATAFVAPTEDGISALNLGLGDVYLMVIAVETPDGPRAYVGPVQSYHEAWLPTLLSDNAWDDRYLSAPAPPPAFEADLWRGERQRIRQVDIPTAERAPADGASRGTLRIAPCTGSTCRVDDPKGLDATLAARSKELLACNPRGAGGVVEVAVELHKGRIFNALVTRNRTGEKALETCVTRVLRTVRASGAIEGKATIALQYGGAGR